MAARRALITGIGGQDGSLLAELLLAEGYEVFGVVRRPTSERFENLDPIRERIELIQADLLDQLSLVDALRCRRPVPPGPRVTSRRPAPAAATASSPAPGSSTTTSRRGVRSTSSRAR